MKLRKTLPDIPASLLCEESVSLCFFRAIGFTSNTSYSAKKDLMPLWREDLHCCKIENFRSVHWHFKNTTICRLSATFILWLRSIALQLSVYLHPVMIAIKVSMPAKFPK